MNSKGIYIDCPDNLTLAWYLISIGKSKLCPRCGEFFEPYDLATGERVRATFCPNCQDLRIKERNRINKARQRERERAQKEEAYTINIKPIK